MITLFKKHPEFNLLLDFIFDTLEIVDSAHASVHRKFEKNVLSKYDNPEEYLKELIKFTNEYRIYLE